MVIDDVSFIWEEIKMDEATCVCRKTRTYLTAVLVIGSGSAGIFSVTSLLLRFRAYFDYRPIYWFAAFQQFYLQDAVIRKAVLERAATPRVHVQIQRSDLDICTPSGVVFQLGPLFNHRHC